MYKSCRFPIIAIVGGDRRHGRAAWPPNLDVRVYGSAGHVGDGEQRRLLSAIRAGRVDRVIALVRWIGHSTTSVLRRACTVSGVRFTAWDRGVSGLVEELKRSVPDQQQEDTMKLFVSQPKTAADLVSVDLLAASYRSDSFPQDWSRERREHGFARYEKWLRLKQRNPGLRFAPTHDIDLFWHLHMLSPVAYHRDCLRNFGRILDHDGGFGKGEGELALLQRVFERTAQLWEAEYGQPYPDDGARAGDPQVTSCWHDCQDRCWHACKDLK